MTNNQSYTDSLSQTNGRILTVFLATAIGFCIPESYAERPLYILIIGILIWSMLYVWQLVLGSSELDTEKFCVCDSTLAYHLGNRTRVSILRLSDSSSPCIVFTSQGCNKLIVRRLADGQNISSYDSHRAPTTAVIVSGPRAYSADASGMVHSWDIETGYTLREFKKHSSKVLSLALSCYSIGRLSKPLISCDDRGQVIVSNVDNDDCIEYSYFCERGLDAGNPTAYLSSAQSVCKRSKLRIVWGTNSGEVHAWDVMNERRFILLGHYGPVTALCIHDTGLKPCVLSSSADWTVRIWCFESGITLRTLQGHSGSVDSLVVLDGLLPLVITAGKDATVRVWDLVSGELCRTLEGHTQEVLSVSLQQSPTLSSAFNLGTRSLPLIISCGSEQSLRIWNLDRIIRDLKWARRREFALFLSQIQMCHYSDAESESSLKKRKLLVKLFSNPDVRNTIAMFL